MPLVEGSDRAAHTSDDQADENSCPICTERLEVCRIYYADFNMSSCLPKSRGARRRLRS